jgi:ribosomal protein L11 methylase PrmA
VQSRLNTLRPAVVWDLGANTGEYSRLASEGGARVVALDGDPAAVERAYRAMRSDGSRILPLWIDLTNPSPSTGWALRERLSLVERGPADLVLALALVHHLAISNNVPLEDVARFLAELAPSVLIEFVPKDDPQAQRLLASRPDIFPDYTREGFERAFREFFKVREVLPVGASGRVIYDLARR